VREGAGKRGDEAAHAYLRAELAQRHPTDGLLSEEAPDDRTRLARRRVWIVDPLDGSREFEERSRDDWAVHVALWEDGRLAAGAVALPARGEVLSTADPPAYPGSREGPLRLVVSRSRPPRFAGALAALLSADIVELGSAGAKTAMVTRGEADAYVHAGGQYEWDSAAPVAVAMVVGLHASRLDGTPLRYNQPRPYLPDIVICRKELAETLLNALARVQPATDE
jgi:3'(2'), 5'-bisphosphate nucleotidase